MKKQDQVATLKGVVTLLERAHYKDIDCDTIIDFYGKMYRLRELISHLEKQLDQTIAGGKIEKINPEPPKKKKASKKEAKKNDNR